jgi:hypothetical protein
MAVIKQVNCIDECGKGYVQIFNDDVLIFRDMCQEPEDNDYDRDHAGVKGLLALLKDVAALTVTSPDALEFVEEWEEE